MSRACVVPQVRQAVPAFITIVLMPLTYSIAYGLIGGICSYILIYLANFILDLISVAFGKRDLQDVLYDNTPDAFQVRVFGRGVDLDGFGESSQEAARLHAHLEGGVSRHFVECRLQQLPYGLHCDRSGFVPSLVLMSNKHTHTRTADLLCALSHSPADYTHTNTRAGPGQQEAGGALQEPLSCPAGARQPGARRPLCCCCGQQQGPSTV